MRRFDAQNDALKFERFAASSILNTGGAAAHLLQGLCSPVELRLLSGQAISPSFSQEGHSLIFEFKTFESIHRSTLSPSLSLSLSLKFDEADRKDADFSLTKRR